MPKLKERFSFVQPTLLLLRWENVDWEFFFLYESLSAKEQSQHSFVQTAKLNVKLKLYDQGPHPKKKEN